ncbi:hypothetical protein JCGZ_22134 [Jatropha curcas]|uniref:Uncharacterized protein n=1 Tax=Jatropha curcas TaxID=180498 RepID=A0A067LIB9_JATCU|nr:hypothetical protein JCGZ_22134 [Jatropha curcas]
MERLSNEEYLIVLDDIWSENYDDWTKLCSPFVVGAPGSKIIITTRNEGVSKLMGAVYVYSLKELSYGDRFSLFTRHALNSNDFNASTDLKEIGKGIVKSIGNLVNLQYIDISNTSSLQEMPLQIGSLIDLHILPEFIVGKVNGLGVKELTKFSHIQGQLHISGLHNETDIREAEFVNLKEKKDFYGLTLEWDGCEQLLSLVEERVGFKRLYSFIKGEKDVLPCNLEVLITEDCNHLEKLPTGLQKHTSLKHLEISYCNLQSLVKVKKGLLPSFLQVLSVKCCKNLKNLVSELHDLTSLKDLKIQYCQKLMSFSTKGWLAVWTPTC